MSREIVRLLDADWSGHCLGRVHSDGRVYKDDWSGTCVGRVENDGTVYGTDWSGGSKGRVEPDGRVFDASWSATCVGRVRPDGSVFDASSNPTPMGRVEQCDDFEFVRKAGAALLLLLRNPEPQPSPTPFGATVIAPGAEHERRSRRRRTKAKRPTTAHGVRLLGVAKSSGYQVVWALPDDRWFGIYCLQNGGIPAQVPTEVDDTIRLQRSLHDSRQFAVVVEGDREFLATYAAGCTEPSLIIVCSEVEELRTFGVRPIDEGWTKGDAPLNIADWL